MPKPSWKVYESNDPTRPAFGSNCAFQETDIDKREPWFHKQVELQKKSAQGKSLYYFFSLEGGKKKYREIWARSESEVTLKYPKLNSLMGQIITAEIMEQKGVSDVDQPDSFLLEHREHNEN